MSYEFLRDTSSGDIYAAKYDCEDDLVGAYGPMDEDEADSRDFRHYSYDAETANLVLDLADDGLLELAYI